MMHFSGMRLTRVWAVVCGCLAIAVTGVMLATTSPSRGSAASLLGAGLHPGTKFTPVAASTLTVPEPFEASDGRIHLAYELLLMNYCC